MTTIRDESRNQATDGKGFVLGYQEMVLAVSCLVADYSWNSRSKARTLATGAHPDELGDEDAPGLEGLAESMAARGQDAPIDVRPVTINSGTAFGIVTGFRRYSAAVLLAKQKRAILGLEPGQIRCRVFTRMSEPEAREANLIENLGRESVSAPDVVYGIGDLRKLNPKIAIKAMAARLNRSEKFVRDAIAICEKGDPKVLDEWRSTPTRPIGLGRMTIVIRHEKERQAEHYQAAVAEVEEGREKGGRKGTVISLDGRARRVGRLLGKLVRIGVVDLAPRFDWERQIRCLVKIPGTEGTGKDLKLCARIANEARDAYETERDKVDDNPDIIEATK